MEGTSRRVRVPGRVNLMGDHTDYNRGLALPMAIDRWCEITATPGGHHTVRARSAQFDGTVDVRLDVDVDPLAVEPAWGRFVAGAVAACRAAAADRDAGLAGTDLAITSSVPPGAGLSSSSALAVALVLALQPAVERSTVEWAELALDAEVRATGVPGGLMDQLTALEGHKDHALLIDFDTLAVEPVALPSEIAVVVAHCGITRSLAGSEYASRRAECESVAARLGLASLRATTLEQVADSPRARHVVNENARVHATARALRSCDIDEVGRLMLESHASLRDDYEVSTAELDALVDAFVAVGAAGARLTGAGFGGCVVAVCAASRAEQVLRDTSARYRDVTGTDTQAFVAHAADGALR